MPTFSTIPNELVMKIWDFVDEPEDIERFALVSQRVYSLSKPSLRAHARLKRLLPAMIIDIDVFPRRPHRLLELLLQNPRLAFYIHEAQIEDWRRKGSQRSISRRSLSRQRIAEFDRAVHYSVLIPPSEKQIWVREIKAGNPDPIVALILMRLTRLKKLSLVYPHTGGNEYLLTTLERITLLPDGGNNLGCSVTQIRPDSGSQVSFKKPSPFFHLKDITMNLRNTSVSVLSKLLRGVKEQQLERFALTTSAIGFDFRLLKRELLGCARGSLLRLALHDDSGSQPYLGPLAGFQHLVEVKVNASLLLGNEEERCWLLEDPLPRSVQELSFFLPDPAEPTDIEDMVDHVFNSKLTRCPSLDTFSVEMMHLVDLDDEEERQLMEKLAGVGVEFEMVEYENF